MSRKYAAKSDYHSASPLFNRSTTTVMAQPQQDGVKEKCQAVREVVPGKSNNEIILVLQFYDYDVERAIQAYLEDGATEALKEWHFSGNKLNNKKKKKNKAKPKPEPTTAAESADQTLSQPPPPSDTIQSNQPSTKPAPVAKPSAPPVVTLPAKEEKPQETTSPAAEAKPQDTHHEAHSHRHHGHHEHSVHGQVYHGHAIAHAAKRERIISEKSTTSISSRSVKPHAGLEKSYKDLQRQTTSLQRLKLVANEEMEKAQKRIRAVMEDLSSEIKKREAELISDMEKTKNAALEILNMRQEKAQELRGSMDRAPSMTEEQISELRSDVKHFVADRKVDEELGRTTRFLYDSDHLISEIRKFGEVLPVKATYSPRRPSISSIASSDISHNDLPSPSVSLTSKSLESSLNSATVLKDMKPNEGLTSAEVAELQAKLNTSLQLQGLPVKSPTSRRPPPPNRDRPGSGTRRPQGSPRRGPPPGRYEGSSRRPPQSGRPDRRDDGSGDASRSQDDPRKNRNARRRQRYRERQREARDSIGHDSRDDKDNPRTDKPKTDSKPNPRSGSSAPKSAEKHGNTAETKPRSPKSSPKLSASKTESVKPVEPEKPAQNVTEKAPSVPVKVAEPPTEKPAPNATAKMPSVPVKVAQPPKEKPNEEKRKEEKSVNGPVVDKAATVVSNGSVTIPRVVNGDSPTVPDSPKDSNMNKLNGKVENAENDHKETPLPQRKQRERKRNEKIMNGGENIMNGEVDGVENHVD